ncbi:hypothetical protein [Aliirhizobium smilacinae]|uniref:Uncharacterized protein n=1 Tax=Aliirhizobium smilacinae TaxID=1395944 RepID=A0A5C4XSR2_9HYPH|nr:hypothetical protein [Rhizobium smilacinae]TNM66217.1 hypothetical protein FHP24_08435 [Rhizobium smilacinae]
MSTPQFDIPALGKAKVTLPHVSILNGPRPQSAARAADAQIASVAAGVATVILVGLDDQNKPHASWFEAEQADAAAVAADLMGFALVDISNDELAAIASVLPKGKLFESGKAFVPFVKRSVYDQLAAHLDEDYLTNAAGRVAAAQAAANSYAVAKKVEIPPRLPEDWSKLMIGDLVLATEDPTEGWFEAIIVEAVGSDKYRLRWKDYPDLPTFTCNVVDLALLHPLSPAR